MPPDHPSEPVPAIGYLRVSMKREEMISPEIQKIAIRRGARQTGRRIIDWVEDLDNTGRNFKRKVMKVIGRVEAKEAAEVLVYRFDRWGRNAAESLANVARVEQAGGRVVSVTEPFDAETAIGKYSRTNAFALAELQSDIIGDNWKAALEARVERQLPGTGGPRFGYIRRGRVRREDDPKRYRRDPGDGEERYETDPATGPVLAELYERYVAGDGASSLLRWLNGTGARTVRGAPFGRRAMFFVLDSGFGAGLLRQHDRDCRCGKNLNKCKNATWVPGAQPPVIGAELWEAYLRRREEMRGVSPRHHDPAYPLAGLVRCGGCGGSLGASHAGVRPGFGYRCINWVEHKGCPGVWVQRRVVEQRVRKEVSLWAADIDAAAAAESARAGAVTRAQVNTAALEREIGRLDRALAKSVRDQAMDESTPASVYENARKGMIAERETAEAALKSARASEGRNGGEFVPVVAGIMAEWDTLPVARLREMLKALIREVRVTRTGVRTPPHIKVIPVWENTEDPGEV